MMEGGGELTREKTRIYVGGLGAGVTEDDLRKTFSALGEVVAVDVVRTKGRSFAYLDFLPSSDKSLPKLFSTYNGCVWKGGKLRLEKAKEHYLLRLKREWEEESEQASKASDNCNADPSESLGTSEKPKKPSSADKPQLNIFFPKLGKVKSLASVGIGKHKYSFQRLQVPSNPTHFCDCEEHSLAFLPTNKKQSSEVEDTSDGINEQELNIMNSVMNKIFERANPSKQVTGKSKSVNGNGVSMNSNDELAAVETDEEDHLTDEDNLVINVATGKNDSMDLLGEMRTMMANQVSTNEKPKSVQNSREKKTVLLSKKRKSPHSEENNDSGTIIPEASRNSQIRSDTHKDSKTKVKSGTKQPASNSLRSLKSTWKDLIDQKGHTPFSISDIIATVPQKKEEELKSVDAPEKNLVRNKKRKSDAVPKTSSSTLHMNKEPATEVGAIATEISIPDILSNDSQQISESDHHPTASQQKEEKSRADDLDVPLIPEVVLDPCKQKEAEPRTDDIVNDLDEHENADSKSGNSKDLKESTEPSPAKHDKDLIRVARGDSWRHKSSWTQLISNTGHSSFSISHIVPDLSFEKHEQQAETFDFQPANKNLDTSAAETTNGQRRKEVISPVKNTSAQKRSLALGNMESEETCPFMRTEESLKEWKKAKASLSSSLNKKKRPVKDSP